MLGFRTHTITLIAILCLSLGICMAETAVPDPPDSNENTAGSVSEEGFLDISFEEFALPEVISYLAEKGQVNIVIDPASKLTTYRVTANLRGVTWNEVLNYLANKYEFEVEISAEGIYTLFQPRRIDLVANKAPLREVIRQIAEDAEFNVIIDSDVEGEVSAFLKQVPWTHALDLILSSSNYVSVKERYNVIRVTTTAKLKEQPETRIFRLNYIEPSGASYIPQIETDFAMKSAADGAKPSSLVEILESIVGKDGLVKYEAANNALIVRAPKKVMEIVEKIITELDNEPLQVAIDVRIYSVNLQKIREVGTKWAQGFIFTANGATATNAVVFPFTNGFDSWESYLHGASSSGPFFTDSPTISGGELNAAQLQMTLKLLDQYTNAETVQQPRITTLDNHPATIHIGDVIRYAEFEQTTTDGGISGGYKEAANSPVELGVQLLIEPHVARKDGNIMMTIIPKIEDARSGTLFEEFGSGSTAIKLPQTKTEFVVSKMIIPNGHTGVLAGFIKTTNSKSGNKIPLLGDIPVLGWLFKNRYELDSKEVLLIFITPTIVSSSTSSDMAREMEEMRQNLHEGFKEIQKEVAEEKIEEGKVETTVEKPTLGTGK